MEKDPKPWSVTASRITYQDRWIKVRSDDCLTSDGTIVAPFHVLEYPDWINVVPVMPDGRVLLVREYRHGRGEIMLGVVAGGIEEGDRLSDDPAMEAARRELREETGYEAKTFVKVLVTHPNSATHNNINTTYLALGLNRAAEQSLDESEDVQVLLRPLDDVLQDLQSGSCIMQAMHVAALYAASHWLKTNEGLK
jgi:8-oxo-dGTP pyrophosphatase MutT (NUDIX family)